MRHPSWLLRSILLLLLGGGAVACYEPVDLVSSEELLVPCVHCVLNPADTQNLRLYYLSKGNVIGRGIDDAQVTFSEYRVDKEGNEKLLREYPFENLGEGRWRLVFMKNRYIEEKALCKLTVALPSGDTLRAKTTMVSYKWRAHSDALPTDNIQVAFDAAKGHHKDIELDLHGEHIVIPYSSLEGNPSQSDVPQYVIYPSAGTVWISKLGWSKAEHKWYLEKELATDKEDLVDGFNRTGRSFTQSQDPNALELFPNVAGRPLHYQYLRLPSRGTTDTLSISGDFTGPHYGVMELPLALLWASEVYILAKHRAMGLPPEENLLSYEVGKVVFRRVSEEYDHYLKDVMQYHLLHDVGTDIIAIYDNTNIYSNIEGGVGIFGAEYETCLEWTCGTWDF